MSQCEMHKSPLQFLFAGDFGLYMHFVSIHYSAGENFKSLTTPHFGVKGHLMSLMLIALKSTLPGLVMISSTSVPICKRFHARQANSEKTTTFKAVPIFDTRNDYNFIACSSTFFYLQN